MTHSGPENQELGARAIPDGSSAYGSRRNYLPQRCRGKTIGDAAEEATARDAVNRAKVALGERGPVWWNDGAPDLNRHLARTGPYALWYADLEEGER